MKCKKEGAKGTGRRPGKWWKVTEHVHIQKAGGRYPNITTCNTEAVSTM